MINLSGILVSLLKRERERTFCGQHNQQPSIERPKDHHLSTRIRTPDDLAQPKHLDQMASADLIDTFKESIKVGNGCAKSASEARLNGHQSSPREPNQMIKSAETVTLTRNGHATVKDESAASLCDLTVEGVADWLEKHAKQRIRKFN
ncbi:unnamed protein product [Protopolystoma xenopodis]|uniref:Uncharacterized protein n=1 Tax=Protopolystoma xenopodis TaxID=117903 RepID=A0A448X251_9PLAT|nr:unnamed protein product [Protopolystoma xenopodis]